MDDYTHLQLMQQRETQLCRKAAQSGAAAFVKASWRGPAADMLRRVAATVDRGHAAGRAI